MSASRSPSPAATTSAGSAASETTRASGIGSTHDTPAPGSVIGASGSSAGAPRPDGSARRPRCSSAVRQTLVAIRYSHVRSDDRPSNVPYDRQARRYVSCTRSSASSSEPSIR